MKNTAWLLGTCGALRESEPFSCCARYKKVFDEVFSDPNTSVSMFYFLARPVEVKERCYTILEYLGDP